MWYSSPAALYSVARVQVLLGTGTASHLHLGNIYFELLDILTLFIYCYKMLVSPLFPTAEP